MVQVRRIGRDEQDALREVRLKALADAPYAFGSTLARESLLTDDDWADRARAGSQGSDRATFLAVIDGSVVGLIGGYIADSGQSEVDLVSMWTDPAVRRSGVGRLLVDAVVGWARERGATHVSLWVTCGNTAAEGLYRSVGFVDVGEYQALPSDPCKDEKRMILTL